MGCGDGYLIERIRSRGAARVVGLDLSEAELAAARARCGDEIELVEGRAESLPFADQSFDCVTSHLALMLMTPIEAVLDELLRVLRPGGRLIAVISARAARQREEDALSWFMRVSRSLASVPAPVLGDERVSRIESLRELLHRFEIEQLEALVLDLSGSVDEVWELLSSLYRYGSIAPEQQGELEARFRAEADRMRRADGSVACAMDLIGIQASRPLRAPAGSS